MRRWKEFQESDVEGCEDGEQMDEAPDQMNGEKEERLRCKLNHALRVFGCTLLSLVDDSISGYNEFILLSEITPLEQLPFGLSVCSIQSFLDNACLIARRFQTR